jgi:hypothetical protein
MFYVQTDDPKIKAAALRAEYFLEALKKNEIKLPEYFTHTTDRPYLVAATITDTFNHDPAPVRTYRTVNPWSSVLGYTKNGIIYVNTRFSIRADISAIAGNLVHELCHVRGYSHKGNRPTAYNLKSVPYVLGYACRDWVADK